MGSRRSQAAWPEPEEMGLRHVSDRTPGIRRRRAGRGFVFVQTDGSRVRDAHVLARIRALAIPPAWRDVWICADPAGHLQATGRDARGRKQHRYHPRWRAVRDEAKFDRLVAFGATVPRLRRRIARLARRGNGREQVLATIVRLLDETLIRVGNEEYARSNGSFGLTTLRNGHVAVRGDELRFRFVAKGGKERHVGITDHGLARTVKRCKELPGQELFAYVDDDGEARPVGSSDVNDFLFELTGERFTAKDFRTWGGTVRAVQALVHAGRGREATSAISEAVEEVAEQLGNTPRICRQCYVHPAVLDAYRDRSLFAAWNRTPSGDPTRIRAERVALAIIRRQRRARPGAQRRAA